MRLSLLAAMAMAMMNAAESRKAPRTQVSVVAPNQSPDLDRSLFKATVDGSPAKVLRVMGPSDDLILLLVLDLSGDLTLVDTARAEIASRLEKMPSNNWVAVLKAQDSLQVLTDPTPDRTKTTVSVNTYTPTGKAGLLNTVEDALALGDAMLRRTNVRVAVVYVTDSNIYNYREDFTNPVINSSDSRDLSRRFPDQLIRERILKLSDNLANLETPLYFVHLSYFSDPINEAYQRGLSVLADQSGGAGAFCRSRGEIPNAIDGILRAAVSHWNVSVELPGSKPRQVMIDLFNGDRDIPNRAHFSFRK